MIGEPANCPNCESRLIIHADDLLPRLDQSRMRVCLDCGTLMAVVNEADREYWNKRLTAEGKFAVPPGWRQYE